MSTGQQHQGWLEIQRDSSLAQQNSALGTQDESYAFRAPGTAISAIEKDGMLYVKASDVLGASASAQSSGKKYDGDKAPLAQGCVAYFGRALRAVADVSAYGAQKYGVAYSEQNWRSVDNAKGRYADALCRHIEAHLRGELIDSESGKKHIDMVAWNALALSELNHE